MPDITMCCGKGCPTKENCYRHKATLNKRRQWYFVKPPADKEQNSCDYYWEIKQEKKDG